MEINDTTISVYLSCRYFGFAPYTIIRNKLNQITDVKLNRALCIYSFVLLTIFCVSTNYALIHDMYSGHSLRMKSTTSRFVYWLDVNMLTSSFLINIVTSLRSAPHTRRVNCLLNKVDKQLSLLNTNYAMHSKKSRNRIKILVNSAFLCLILMLVTDFSTWYRIARQLQSNEQSHGVFDHNFAENVYYLAPFYLLYTSFVPLHAKFASTTYRIGLRYRSLNNVISTYTGVADRFSCFPSDDKRLPDFVSRLFTIHESLGQVVNHVSSEFGLTVLILMASCLFHLVISTYFVLVEILGDNDVLFAILQAMWIIFHVTRLVFIIEPCHLISLEAQRTVGCVSRLLRLRHNEFMLKHFWQKLMTDQIAFIPCGICRIDRQLLTSIGGATATYLIILLQFQR